MFAGQGKMRRAALGLPADSGCPAAGWHAQGRLADQYLRTRSPCPSLAWISFQDCPLSASFPTTPAKGEEGVTAQGAILIGLLVLIGLASWKGIENIHEGFNRWTWIALGLVGLTLLTAAVGMSPHAGGLDILVNG
ncbi:MAG: hypothetical protein MZW92_42510 [Comamonadaceae bacterium]|nr:hypothetical protein [Comamonadaceae bacterium]